MNFRYIFLILAFINLQNCQIAAGWLGKIIKNGFNCRALRKSSQQPQRTLSQEELIAEWFEPAKKGNLDAIHKVINLVDVNVQNADGDTALICASDNGHIPIVKFLLQAPNINVNAQNNKGNTALIGACYNGHENIVEMLLQVPEIIVNAKNLTGNNAFMQAASHGRSPKSALAILSEGGLEAVFNKKENIIKMLMQAPGMELNAQDYQGDNAFIKLVWGWINRSILTLFLNTPSIKINLKNRNGETALTMAKYNTNPWVLQMMKAKVDELTIKAFDAVNSGNLETLRVIVEQLGIDGIVDAHGNTLLDKACAADKPDIIKYLLLSAQDPQELLSRFPFEAIQPTSEIFNLCMNLAYIPNGGKLCAHDKCRSENCTKRCGRCKKVNYCSAECQKAHWKSHKPECKPVE